MGKVISLDEWRESFKEQGLQEGPDQRPWKRPSPKQKFMVTVSSMDNDGVNRVLRQEMAGEDVFDVALRAALSWKKIFIFGDRGGITDVTTMHTLNVEISLINNTQETT